MNKQKNYTMNDKQTTIEEIKQKIINYRKARAWANEDPKDVAISLVLEATELLEYFQFNRGKDVEQEKKLYGPIADELADVLWWVVVMGERMGSDIARAFEVKLAKNEEKYPVEIFGSDMSLEEKRKIYYKIKGRYRSHHPLADEESDI